MSDPVEPEATPAVGAITIHVIRDTDDQIFDVFKSVKTLVGDAARSEVRLQLGIRPRVPTAKTIG